MFTGTQLLCLGTGAKTYDTPWFPASAENAYFTYEIIQSNFGTGSPAGSLVIKVYTKNREDSGSEGPGSPYTFSQIGSTAFYEAHCTGLLELVRFEIILTAGATPPTGQEGVCYRILAPTWYDSAV